MTYLNPVMSIGSQITEILLEETRLYREDLLQSRLREIEASEEFSRELQEERKKLLSMEERKLSKKEAKRLAKLRAISFLRMVKLPEPERVFKMYPFELSGGMRQRAMIAMALVRRPKLILADEITTALDVTVQAQILRLLGELKNEIDASIMLITHDLAVVAEVCDRVAVMYAGNIVELAEVKELFKNPLHPYTQGLLASIPRTDAPRLELSSIAGSVPDLVYPPAGCRFHPRCPKAFSSCPGIKPELVEVKPGHKVACLLFGPERDGESA
jgi:oligopeptide/dipeptide ABC transporter ATP-binding protein